MKSLTTAASRPMQQEASARCLPSLRSRGLLDGPSLKAPRTRRPWASATQMPLFGDFRVDAAEGHEAQAAELILHFLRVLDRLDKWNDYEMWRIVSDYRDQLSRWQKTYTECGMTEYLLADAMKIWAGLVSLKQFHSWCTL